MKCSAVVGQVTPIFALVFFVSWQASGVSGAISLSLTGDQQKALDSLRTKVLDKLPDGFMKQDTFLIGYLNAEGFDVDRAKELIEDNLKWRKENSVDTIHTEDFPDLEDYKAYLESYDREGQPIITSNFGDWDVRKATLAGLSQRLQRKVIKSLEMASRKVWELYSAGKNITQWDYIINMNNYNEVQHGCDECMAFYVDLVNTYERHYPGYVDKIMLINTPPKFELVLQVIRPLMSPTTREALKVYNHDETVWKPILFKIASPDELPPEYGGTKIYTSQI